jgi:hypothetical protein
MATNTWSAAANGVWSADGNWSLGHAPLAAEDIVFDVTSVKNCTVDVSPSVASLTISVAYTGVWDMTGQTMTIAGNMSDHGITGAHTYGNGFVFNGASAAVEFHPGNAAGAVCTNAILTFNGTTAPTLALNTQLSVKPFKQLILAASVPLTVSGVYSLYITGPCPVISTGAGSSLASSTFLELTGTAAGNIWNIAGTFSGTGGIIVYMGASSIIINIPATTHTGTGALYLNSGVLAWTNSTFLVTGNLSFAGALTCSGAGAGTLLDFNNFNAAFTGSLNLSSVNNTLTIRLRSGTFTCTTLTLPATANYTLYFDDAIINTAGNLLCSAAATVYAGNAVITMGLPPATHNITTNTKVLPTLRLNSPGKILTLVDNVTCTNFIVLNGTVLYGAFTITTAVKNPVFSANVPLSPMTLSTCINMLPASIVSMR